MYNLIAVSPQFHPHPVETTSSETFYVIVKNYRYWFSRYRDYCYNLMNTLSVFIG